LTTTGEEELGRRSALLPPLFNHSRKEATMLDTTRAVVALAAAQKHAEALGLADQLEGRLRFLRDYAGGKTTRCRLRPDFAPYSFEFVMERSLEGEWTYWFTGGLIFHGPHDGHGSGGAPTFAVTLESTHGWSIHT